MYVVLHVFHQKTLVTIRVECKEDPGQAGYSGESSPQQQLPHRQTLGLRGCPLAF